MSLADRAILELMRQGPREMVTSPNSWVTNGVSAAG